MVVAQERLQRLSVGGHAIGPEILAHEGARFRNPFLNERQSHLRRRGVTQLFDRHLHGLLEGLEHRPREAGVLFGQGASHADQMHDRENTRALETILSGGNRVREKPADVWRGFWTEW